MAVKCPFSAEKRTYRPDPFDVSLSQNRPPTMIGSRLDPWPILREGRMPAYVINRLSIRDTSYQEEYYAKVGPLLARHGGRQIAGGPPVERLGGDFELPKRVAILEFPTIDHAKAMWNDPEYALDKGAPGMHQGKGHACRGERAIAAWHLARHAVSSPSGLTTRPAPTSASGRPATSPRAALASALEPVGAAARLLGRVHVLAPVRVRPRTRGSPA
jgi:uncharacterized protein (DUF1330 family)